LASRLPGSKFDRMIRCYPPSTPWHAYRVRSVKDLGQQAVRVFNATDFLRPHRTGRLQVLAVAIRQGRTLQLWQVEIRRPQDKKLVARCRVRLQNIDAGTQPELDAPLATALDAHEGAGSGHGDSDPETGSRGLNARWQSRCQLAGSLVVPNAHRDERHST
jgi:hypothetical protein